MNIIQFLRILWARKWLIVLTMVTSVVGATIVVLLVQPRYQATARINLEVFKPDPVTGNALDIRSAGPYFDRQIELIKDFAVTGPVVDRLGWLSDPGRIQAYQSRPPSDTRDFRRWLAQGVKDNTDVGVSSSTVVEITFKSPSPAEAKIAAEALRDAYMAAALAERQQDATKMATWYTGQTEVARRLAEAAELKKAQYERETGIIMQSNNMDLDSGRLAALANQAGMPTQSAGVPAGSDRGMQLAAIDAQIAQVGSKLGPNHPEMIDLKARRALIAQLVARDDAAARAAASGETGAAALSRVLAQEKAKVINQRDKVEHLNQLQAEVDLRRDQYKRTAAKAAELSLQASLTDPQMTPMGDVIQPTNPTFPNKTLMLGGSLGLGLGLGLALALLLELLSRRVRGMEDLNLPPDISCVAVVQSPTLDTHWVGRLLARRKPVPSPA